ncbi:hypothetical protein C3492_19450 [Streptomyces sp. Ru62]|nr:hypothetical protein C3492_19450 [Streptomyces sp. Ru62]
MPADSPARLETTRSSRPPRPHVVFETTDLASGTWTPSTDYALPAGPRHGTVLPVTEAEYERLLRTYGQAQLTKYVGFGSLYVRSAWPPSRSEYWSPKLAMMS